MLNVTLKPSDTIEQLMPHVETAMQAGEICRVANIDCLDLFEITALRLLVGARHLLDAANGQEIFARPGFQLIGVDSAGEEHALG